MMLMPAPVMSTHMQVASCGDNSASGSSVCSLTFSFYFYNVLIIVVKKMPQNYSFGNTGSSILKA